MVEFAILFDHERPSLCCLLSNLSLGGQAKKMAWFLLFTAMRSNPFHVDPFLDSPSFSHMKGHYFPVVRRGDTRMSGVTDLMAEGIPAPVSQESDENVSIFYESGVNSIY